MTLTDNGQKILDLVKQLNVVELNDLVKAIETEFGVSATPVMVAGGAAAASDDAGASDALKVELTSIGQQKIGVIKVVKETLNLGLKEAKDLVEKAPVVIKEGISQEEADALKAKLEEVGATVNFK